MRCCCCSSLLLTSDDATLRQQIRSADDIVIQRPVLPPRTVGADALAEAAMLPSFVDAALHPVPREIRDMLQSVWEKQLDVRGAAECGSSFWR